MQLCGLPAVATCACAQPLAASSPRCAARAAPCCPATHPPLRALPPLQKTSKKCPKCGMATQKAEGCNKMACGGCGAYWCWRCNKEIDGYRHFRTGECILFDEAEILRCAWFRLLLRSLLLPAAAGLLATSLTGPAPPLWLPRCLQVGGAVGGDAGGGAGDGRGHAQRLPGGDCGKGGRPRARLLLPAVRAGQPQAR